MIGRMKLTLIDCPIAAIPSPSTASAVAREQTLSTRRRHHAAVHQTERLAQLVAHRDADPGVVGIVVEPLGADQGVEVGSQAARVVRHRVRTLSGPAVP